MSTRFTVQRLDGTRQSSFARWYDKQPIVMNLFIGDSNFTGTNATWSDDMLDMVPSSTVFKSGTTTGELGSSIYWGNWDTFAGTPGLGVAPADPGATPPVIVGRNGIGTNTPPSGGGPFQRVRNDLGWASAAGTVTVDPMWSLSAHLQSWYQSHLSLDTAVPASEPAKNNFNGDNPYGQYWLKHGLSGAGYARKIVTRRYVGGGGADELQNRDNLSSLHPDAGDSIDWPVWSSITANIAAMKAQIAAIPTANSFFDTVYLNAGSFDMGHFGGFQVVSNFKEFIESLAMAIGLPDGATPNVVMVEPLFGAYEPERIGANLQQFERLKAQFKSAAFVNARDLAMDGSNHLSGKSVVELGARLAQARNALPDAVIYEI